MRLFRVELFDDPNDDMCSGLFDILAKDESEAKHFVDSITNSHVFIYEIPEYYNTQRLLELKIINTIEEIESKNSNLSYIESPYRYGASSGFLIGLIAALNLMDEINIIRKHAAEIDAKDYVKE